MAKIEDKEFLGQLCTSGSRIELWLKFLELRHARTMLEIGVWKGDFAEQVLRSCRSIERYYMVDPWANLPDWNKPFNVATELFDDIYEEAIHKTQFAADRIAVLRGRTKEVISRIPDGSLDFAYIDGDHTLRGITIDLMKVLPKIKDGGFIGGDDFIATPWQHDVRYEPSLVCPYGIYFAEAMDLPIVALPHNQFLIQKDKSTRFSFLDTTGGYQDISLNKLASAPLDDSQQRLEKTFWLSRVMRRRS